jgi:signal peptidase II
MFWGPLARLGLTVAAVIALLDQALKLWLLFAFDLQSRGVVRLTPFLDLVLVWNRGISYGLFQQDGPLGQWVLLALTAFGNAIDRVAYGAVADFVLLHLTTASFSFKWYVFNLADAAIVAGVAGLLYDSVASHRAAKQP